MAAQGWQDELARRAEEGSARLREVLSLGLGFLRSELGLDLGLEPRRYPGWVILVGTAALGLLLPLLLCYGWAAACAGARRKRRSPPRRREEAAPAPAPAPGPDDAGLPRSLRGDEPKKRSRKKAPDKPKPNGRTVEVADEEVVRTPRNITAKQPLETDKKNEKFPCGIPGWHSGLAPAFGPGRDPGDPGSNPASGLPVHGACFSLCLCLCLSLSLCDYHK
uniref:Metadherin n=1 Tax=Canis lupus familiaris TaxID=9615 RepID=A0A8C0P2I2_CANLF